ncbi:hypothetical protein [Rickettsia felis]|uniref:hypothetical protein n=1 Tax=Rickettsia felis TaxID=42862 RepID=UPI000AEDF9AE|nr:hypothetical protein [Rickettsia felis]
MSFPQKRGVVAWLPNRHCEERSDVAIQKIIKKNSDLQNFFWIASSNYYVILLAMTKN